jgi:hypothetical protein
MATSGILPRVNASTDKAAIPTNPNMPTMNCVVRLAYIQVLSVWAKLRPITSGPASQESIEDFIMRGGHLLRGPVQFHLALMDEANPVANFENRRNIVTDHHHGQTVLLLGIAN